MQFVSFESREIHPSKIVCVGRNYVAHIEELKNETPAEPVVFMKPNSAIAQEIRFIPGEDVQYEGELSFLVWNGALAAVGFGFDFTKRDLQAKLKTKGLPWERAKAFDGSAVFSEFVRLDGDTSGLSLQLELNNKIVQQGDVGLMIFKPEFLLAHISQFISFNDGDILMTGTPKGVGGFKQGDEFCGRIFANRRLLLERRWSVI